MLSVVISTIAFFVLSYYLKRWTEEHDFPKGPTLTISILVMALMGAYGIAWLVDKVAALAGV